MSSNSLQVLASHEGLLLEWQDIRENTVENHSEHSLQLQQDLHQRYNSDSNDWLLALGFTSDEIDLSPSLDFWREFAKLFVETLIHQENLEKTREKTNLTFDSSLAKDLLSISPLVNGSEYLNTEFLYSEWRKLNKTFSKVILAYDGSVEEFIHSFSPQLQLAGRIYFHLVESKKENAPFAFLATYSALPEQNEMASSKTTSSKADKTANTKHLPLKHALQEYKGDKLLELLGTVHRAAKESLFLSGLMESGELFHPLAWSEQEAFIFLQEVPLYQSSGIICRIPNWWSQKTSKPVVSISIGENETSFVGIEALLDCQLNLSINGVPITPEEATILLEESNGLSLIKNKWVAVDKEKLEQALQAYEKTQAMLKNGELSFKEAMSFQLTPEKLLGLNIEKVELGISNGKWLQDITNKLRTPDLVDSISLAKDFLAKLRPYQQVGLNWLGLLDSLGFGACLADDMGLGKTLQILAFLNYKSSDKIKTLLVVPASLIANWSAEIEKFSPKLKYLLAHPAHLKQVAKKLSEKQISEVDLVITTYSMAQRYELLKEFNWDYIILDEAQAIKNPNTNQTIEIKKYKAKNRIILTGTPVENHLGDLWSLFDFINPGLLGNIKEFGQFAKKLKEDNSGYARLRQVISPYILRRLKTDKNIIDDLPEKIEMKSYAELSKKQAVLYKQLLKELEDSLHSSDGIKRNGLIFSALMKFKQLCNHPDQFLGVTSYQEEHSGKFIRLREICETILQKREKVLVFTQFKELTEPLSNFLSNIFGREGLVLHGSVEIKKRKSIVEQFQQKDKYLPFMILSLKAGGVGLNLTEANHVIHFDRWWNPAVENQATDRAFRIGQKKNVIVHKFITRGTIEEKIDQMLEAKTRLSDEIINSDLESQIIKLKNDQLLDLFRLGSVVE